MHITVLPVTLSVTLRLLCVSVANPLASTHLLPRSPPKCANLPNTIVGADPSHNSSQTSAPSLHRRANDYAGLVWCQPSSTTWIRITFLKPVPPTDVALVQNMILEASTQVDTHIRGGRKSNAKSYVIMKQPAWLADYDGYCIYPLTSSSKADKPMTWGTLERALGVLLDFMLNMEPGTGLIKVWEGSREVGSIVIAGPPTGRKSEALDKPLYEDPNEAGPSSFPGSLNDAGPSDMAGSSNQAELGYGGEQIG